MLATPTAAGAAAAFERVRGVEGCAGALLLRPASARLLLDLGRGV